MVLGVVPYSVFLVHDPIFSLLFLDATVPKSCVLTRFCMEKQQQQYVWWGIGAVALVAIGWLAFGTVGGEKTGTNQPGQPALSLPRPAATNLVGEIIAGVLLPTSGAEQVLGKTINNAIDLAAEEINADHGVVGKKLVFSVKDSVCSGDQTQALVTESKVQAIVGVVGGTCADEKTGFLSAVNDNNVIALASTDVADQIANASGHVFRFTPSSLSAGTAAASFATGALQAKHATALVGNTTIAKEMADAFVAGVLRKGGDTANTVVVGQSPDDVIGAINTAVDVLYVVPADVTQLVRFLQHIKEQKLTAHILIGGIVLSPAEREANKALLEGVTFVTPFYDYQDERMQQFIKLYKARYGEEPAYPLYAANAYSQTYLLRDLIEKDGYDGAKMQKTLQAPLTGWSGGAFGKVDLDKMGDTLQRSFTAWKMEGGALVSKGTVQ